MFRHIIEDASSKTKARPLFRGEARVIHLYKDQIFLFLEDNGVWYSQTGSSGWNFLTVTGFVDRFLPESVTVLPVNDRASTFTGMRVYPEYGCRLLGTAIVQYRNMFFKPSFPLLGKNGYISPRWYFVNDLFLPECKNPIDAECILSNSIARMLCIPLRDLNAEWLKLVHGIVTDSRKPKMVQANVKPLFRPVEANIQQSVKKKKKEADRTLVAFE